VTADRLVCGDALVGEEREGRGADFSVEVSMVSVLYSRPKVNAANSAVFASESQCSQQQTQEEHHTDKNILPFMVLHVEFPFKLYYTYRCSRVKSPLFQSFNYQIASLPSSIE
jgi:hypothetical protein